MMPEYKHNAMDKLQKNVGEWTGRTFPQANPQSAAAHLLSEAVEIYMALGGEDAEVEAEAIVRSAFNKLHGDIGPEIADVTILALDLACRLGLNLYDEVVQKMGINELRTWGKANTLGFYEHVREETKDVGQVRDTAKQQQEAQDGSQRGD